MLIHPYNAIAIRGPSTYLLHFSHPQLRNRHYISFTELPFAKCLSDHRAGKNYTTKMLLNRGYVITALRVWEYGTNVHYKMLIKRGRAHGQFCLACHPCKKAPTTEIEGVIKAYRKL